MPELRIKAPSRAAAAAQSQLSPDPALASALFLDNGVAVYDLQRWYDDHLPKHPLMAELLNAGWELIPFPDLTEAELAELSEQIDLFNESPDWLSPVLLTEPETAAELAAQFAEFLTPPPPTEEKQEENRPGRRDPA